MTESAIPTTGSSRSPRLLRVVAGLWLSVFAFVTGAIPIVDALLGHGANVEAHWEDPGDRTCPPQHDASACQLSQVLTSGRKSDGAALGAPIEVAFRVDLPESVSMARLATPAGLTASPRGPPLG